MLKSITQMSYNIGMKKENIIERMLKEKNITKYRFCKDNGIPYSTLENILSGRTEFRNIKVCVADRIVTGLGCKIEDILWHPYLIMDGRRGKEKNTGTEYTWAYNSAGSNYKLLFEYEGEQYEISGPDLGIEKEQYLEAYDALARCLVWIAINKAELYAAIRSQS